MMYYCQNRLFSPSTLLLVAAGLVGYGTGCFAGRLAGSLAFSASGILIIPHFL